VTSGAWQVTSLQAGFWCQVSETERGNEQVGESLVLKSKTPGRQPRLASRVLSTEH